MINNYDSLGYFTLFSSFGKIIGLFTYALFFARAWLFYKKGAQYAHQIGRIPKLSEAQYVFLALGISGPILMGFFPFLGIIALIISAILFLKILAEILSFKDATILKPEKMASIGIGMGISGTLGFILGVYKGLEDKKTLSATVSEHSHTNTENK